MPSKNSDSLWFGAAGLTVALFWVLTYDWHPALAPGDTGRDLYAFWMTYQGKWPCRDYWWQYGPLVPFYFATWFSALGANLVAVRLALGGIYLALSLAAYRTIRLLAPPPAAFLGAIAFLHYDMGYTFNHIGSIPFLMFSIFSLWEFFLTRKRLWAYAGALACAAVALVKINAGVAAFGAYFTSLLLDAWLDRKKSSSVLTLTDWLTLPSVFTGLTVAGYFPFFSGQSVSWIRHCLTVGNSQLTAFDSPWVNLKLLILRLAVWEPARLIPPGVLILLGILALTALKRGKVPPETKRIWRPAAGSLLLFAAANSTDYFVKEGLIYRLDFWLFPIGVLSAAVAGGWTSFLLNRKVRAVFVGVLFLALAAIPIRNVLEIRASRVPQRFLTSPQGRAYLGGPVEYIRILNGGSLFIQNRTWPGETILAIPYDAIYCFLSGRRHAVRDLLFMRNMFFSKEHERSLIREIEEQRVRLVVLSNRIKTEEKSAAGEFGVTHLKVLSRYLSGHYREVKVLGDWNSDPRVSHAIKILERKD